MSDESTARIAELLKTYAADAPSEEHARIAYAANSEFERLIHGKPTRRQSLLAWGKRFLGAAALSAAIMGLGYLAARTPQQVKPAAAQAITWSASAHAKSTSPAARSQYAVVLDDVVTSPLVTPPTLARYGALDALSDDVPIMRAADPQPALAASCATPSPSVIPANPPVVPSAYPAAVPASPPYSPGPTLPSPQPYSADAVVLKDIGPLVKFIAQMGTTNPEYHIPAPEKLVASAPAAMPAPHAAPARPSTPVAKRTLEDAVASHKTSAAQILMYHMIGPQEGRFTESPERFKRDLQYFYDNGYRLLTVSEYVSGDYELPAGMRPLVLTFDDSTEGQFRILSDGRIDPASAVGVMEEFKQEHPGYRTVATFYVNMKTDKGLPPFEQPGLEKQKLEFLAKNHEIGDHGMRHRDFAKMTAEEVREDIRAYKEKMAELIPGYGLKSFAYPFGSLPKAEVRAIIENEFPYTMHAWRNKLDDHHTNISRIEVGPQDPVQRYVSRNAPKIASLSDGNAYKGVQNLSPYARNHPQLPSQHPQTVRQPDDRGSGRSGLQGEGDGARRQDSPLQYRQEGDQGRGPLLAREQGSAPGPLRDRYAGSSDRRDGQDPVGSSHPALLPSQQPLLEGGIYKKQ